MHRSHARWNTGALILLCSLTPSSALAAAPGVGPCAVAFSKLDYDQVGADDGRLEIVELRAAVASHGQTLGACGVTRLVPWDGATCAPESAARAVELTDVVIPSSGRVVLARAGATPRADATASAKSGSWLENGPDLLVLEGPLGPLAALGYGAKHACAPGPHVVDAGVDAETTAGAEHWLLECADGWRRLPRVEAELGEATTCPPPADTGAAGASGAGGAASVTVDGGVAPSPACAARVVKLDVTQPGGDRAEAVEIELTGDVAAGAVARDCGVERVAWINANTERDGCGALAGSYLERVIGGLTIPPSRRLVVGNRADADAPLSEPTEPDLVQPGPDYVSLVGVTGEPVDAVMYESATGAVASCDLSASHAPADPRTRANRVLVRCADPDGRWLAAPEEAITWRAPVACPPGGWPDELALAEIDGPDAVDHAPDVGEHAPTPRGARGATLDESPASHGCATSPTRGAPGWTLALAAWLTTRTLRGPRRRAPGRSRRAPSAPRPRG